MKKTIIIILLICIALSVCACGSTGSNNSSSSSYSSSSSKGASLSECKQAAENAVVRAIYNELHNNRIRYSDYDIDATGYKVGNIEQSGRDYYTVYITVYLYDKYGSLKKTKKLSPRVEIDNYGNVEWCADIGRLD